MRWVVMVVIVLAVLVVVVLLDRLIVMPAGSYSTDDAYEKAKLAELQDLFRRGKNATGEEAVRLRQQRKELMEHLQEYRRLR